MADTDTEVPGDESVVDEGPTRANQEPADPRFLEAKEDTDKADALRPNIMSLGRVNREGRLIGEPFPYLVGAGENVTPTTAEQDVPEDVREREDDEAVKRAAERDNPTPEPEKPAVRKDAGLRTEQVGAGEEARTAGKTTPGTKR